MNHRIEHVPANDDLERIVGQITETMMGVASYQSSATLQPANLWSTSVHIAGPFNVVVTVTAPRSFAAWMASTFFEQPVEEVEDAGAADALGEFGNVVAGNVKSLMSYLSGQVCSLALPVVAPGPSVLTQAITKRAVDLMCGAHVLRVEVWELAG